MKDDTSAMINLARMYTDGGHVLREDDAKASELFKRAADLGSAEAIGELAVWQNGRFDYSVPDRTTAKNILRMPQGKEMYLPATILQQF